MKHASQVSFVALNMFGYVLMLEPDLLQVEDSRGDPLDTIHHPLGVWRPLASHRDVLVQV